MILASGARGPGFNSRSSPIVFCALPSVRMVGRLMGPMAKAPPPHPCPFLWLETATAPAPNPHHNDSPAANTCFWQFNAFAAFRSDLLPPLIFVLTVCVCVCLSLLPRPLCFFLSSPPLLASWPLPSPLHSNLSRPSCSLCPLVLPALSLLLPPPPPFPFLSATRFLRTLLLDCLWSCVRTCFPYALPQVILVLWEALIVFVRHIWQICSNIANIKVLPIINWLLGLVA